jgi:hypothetical protein
VVGAAHPKQRAQKTTVLLILARTLRKNDGGRNARQSGEFHAR